MLGKRLPAPLKLYEMEKETKNPETKMIADTGYGRVFFENEPFLAKLQTNMKLYGSYYIEK